MTLEEIYRQKCNEPSDINEHLPVLREYASMCQHATEFGVRGIVSTWALLCGLAWGAWRCGWDGGNKHTRTLVSYDLTHPGKSAIDQVQALAIDSGVRFKFLVGDTRKITIDETDLLFIDTFHTYNQLNAELRLHSTKARKFIILHDTETFGRRGEAGDEAGLLVAMDLFLAENLHWKMRAQFYNNNGLTILERK